MIIIVCGLPGSGKSFFANNLAAKLHAPHISSDQTRKEMSALGQYTFTDKMTVYQAMAKIADQNLADGKSVVVDATFHHHTMREIFTELGKHRQISVFFILIQASEVITKKRLSNVRPDSEADYPVYLQIKNQFEKLDMPYLKLQSENDNIDSMLNQAIEYLTGSYE